MKVLIFLNRQLIQVRKGGLRVLTRKIKSVIFITLNILGCVLAIPFMIVLRLIRPIVLVRIGNLISSRIGHFTANTEMYLCEQETGINVPKQRYIDLFYLHHEPICNEQLLKIWRRQLRIFPYAMLAPLDKVNRIIPGGELHVIHGIKSALDTKNLLDKCPSHLKFTPDEEVLGERLLRDIGIPPGEKFICLNVRDNAYLKTHLGNSEFSYHDYRDSDIQSYVLAAEALAERGYYVIRMGAKVNTSIKTKSVRIIDYATNGMRNEFMDIYLGVKCYFAISTGSGWDAIPEIARRPIVYVNFVPLGYLHTSREEFISISRRYYSAVDNRELTISEIISCGAAFFLQTEEYRSNNIVLAENTPLEIRDVVIEMQERLSGTWKVDAMDEELQRRFWALYPVKSLDTNGNPLHGKICARYGADFLRHHPEWLQ